MLAVFQPPLSNASMNQDAWHNVVRVAHLSGGVRAVSNPGPRVYLLPRMGEQAAVFELTDYRALFGLLMEAGFDIIGCDFIESPEELSGIMEPQWRAFMQPLAGMSWPPWEVRQDWANISHRAGWADRMSTFEKARHVSMQLRICAFRLRDLSEAYHRHLTALCRGEDFKPGHMTDGQYSEHLFISAHAMFGELASLRDHLAMFVAREVLGNLRPNIDSWSRLLEDKAFLRSNHAIVPTLQQEASWLERFGQYRNLVVHNAPLGETHGAIMVTQVRMETPLGDVPTVSLRLPSDPEALVKRLRSGAALNSFAHWLEISRAKMEGPELLTYCQEVFNGLVRLAHSIARHSPVEGKIASITDEDLMEPVTMHTRIIPSLHLGPRN